MREMHDWRQNICQNQHGWVVGGGVIEPLSIMNLLWAAIAFVCDCDWVITAWSAIFAMQLAEQAEKV